MFKKNNKKSFKDTSTKETIKQTVKKFVEEPKKVIAPKKEIIECQCCKDNCKCCEHPQGTTPGITGHVCTCRCHADIVG